MSPEYIRSLGTKVVPYVEGTSREQKSWTQESIQLAVRFRDLVAGDPSASDLQALLLDLEERGPPGTIWEEMKLAIRILLERTT